MEGTDQMQYIYKGLGHVGLGERRRERGSYHFSSETVVDSLGIEGMDFNHGLEEL